MSKSLTALLTILVLLVGASPAPASERDVINDCTDDEILAKTYTQKEYRDALATLPADADQYGNCRDIIARAQDASATKGSKGKTTKRDDSAGAVPATSGNGTPAGATTGEPSTRPAEEQLAAATPQDRSAADAAAREPTATDIVPSAVGAGSGTDAGTRLSDLPAPILALLAFLAAGALGLGAVGIRRVVNARGA